MAPGAYTTTTVTPSSFTSGGGNRRRYATGWNPVVPWTARRVWTLPHLGWELTGYMGKGFSLFRTWEPDAPELAHRPGGTGVRAGQAGKAGSVVRHPHANLRPGHSCPPPMAPFGLDEPVLSLVTGSGDNLFLCILSEWIAIYMSFRSFSSFFALRRRLRAGSAGYQNWRTGHSSADGLIGHRYDPLF